MQLLQPAHSRVLLRVSTALHVTQFLLLRRLLKLSDILMPIKTIFVITAAVRFRVLAPMQIRITFVITAVPRFTAPVQIQLLTVTIYATTAAVRHWRIAPMPTVIMTTAVISAVLQMYLLISRAVKQRKILPMQPVMQPVSTIRFTIVQNVMKRLSAQTV